MHHFSSSSGKSRLDPRRLSLASSGGSSVTGFWDDRLSLRPEYDICPMHSTSPILPKHSSSDTSSLRMASTSSASLCSCEFVNVSFAPDGRLDSPESLQGSFRCHSLGSGGRHPNSAAFLRNTSSLDRADFKRQKRPRSLNLSRPISSYDLKFPAIEELELKTCISASAVPTVSEQKHARSALSRNLMYSSCRSDRGSSRTPQEVSPFTSTDIAQTNNGEVHWSSTCDGTRSGAVVSLDTTPCVGKSHKSLLTNIATARATGASFTRSMIYHSTPHRLRRSKKLKRSSSHAPSEFKGSPMLLSIKPLTPDLPVGGSTGSTQSLSSTATNSLRYSRNLSSREDMSNEFSLTDSPLVDNVFPSPSHPLPAPLTSTPAPLPSTPVPLANTLGSLPGTHGSLPGTHGSLPGTHGSFPGTHGSLPGTHGSLPGTHGSLPGTHGSLASEPVARCQFSGMQKPFACQLDGVTSLSAESPLECCVPPCHLHSCVGVITQQRDPQECDLCNRIDEITLRRDHQECGSSRLGTSDYFSMVPSVTGDTDNWYLAGAADSCDRCHGVCHNDSCNDSCNDNCDSFINSCSSQTQQKRFVFYNDLNRVQLEFVNEKDEETAL